MSIDNIIVRLNQVATADESAFDCGELGYMPRGLVVTTLPHSDLRETRYIRKNGAYELELVAMHSDVRLPYGPMSRMIISWITAEAVRSRSRNLVFDCSMAAFLRELGYEADGGPYGTIRRLKEQTKRLACCGFSFRDSRQLHEEQRRQVLIADRSKSWLSKSPQHKSRFKYEICLSKVFYEEIVRNPVPVDLRVLRKLKSSSLRMDIYLWLTHRMFYLSKKTKIPWDILPLQFGSGYAGTTAGRRAFKMKFRKELQFVADNAYRNVNFEMTETHLILMPSPVPIASQS